MVCTIRCAPLFFPGSGHNSGMLCCLPSPSRPPRCKRPCPRHISERPYLSTKARSALIVNRSFAGIIFRNPEPPSSTISYPFNPSLALMPHTVFQNGPWLGCNTAQVYGLGHIGHIEGILQDLFTYRKYRKKFRKIGEKCPKCPIGVIWSGNLKIVKNCNIWIPWTHWTHFVRSHT